MYQGLSQILVINEARNKVISQYLTQRMMVINSMISQVVKLSDTSHKTNNRYGTNRFFWNQTVLAGDPTSQVKSPETTKPTKIIVRTVRTSKIMRGYNKGKSDETTANKAKQSVREPQ